MSPRSPHAAQHGLSMTELMLGVAVGLFILLGATALFVDHLNSNRVLLVETRLNQDLRTAADLIVREIRRAGYWQDSLKGAIFPASLNPYRAMTPTGSTTDTTTFSRSDVSTAENDVLDSNEQFGFRLANGAIAMQIGEGTWELLTDSGAMVVTELSITPVLRTVPLGQFCTPTCAAGSTGCPTLVVRMFDIVIRGHAPPPNTGIIREARESVRVRNDELAVASCP